MVGVYKITNKLNNKSYIGQSNNIKRRWSDHISSALKEYAREYDSPLHKAMRTDGIENFEMTILEECNPEDLYSKEQYWIKYYDTFVNGYNQNKGGKNGDAIEVCGFNILTGEQLFSYDSISEAERHHSRGICESLNDPYSSRTANGYCWLSKDFVSQFSCDELKEFIFNKYPYVVCQLDYDGNLLNKYKTVLIAKESINGNSCGDITLCCENKRQSANGYQWCYYKDLKNRINCKYEKKSNRTKRILQYSKEGIFIKAWDSLTQAAEGLGLQISHISSVCSNKRKHCGGFIWKFESCGE